MKKKFLSLALAASMMMTCMAGCGKKDEEKDSSTTENKETSSDSDASETPTEEVEITGEITFISNRTDLAETTFKEYAAAFEAKYPGTTVKIETMENYEGDISTRLSTGDYGDVFMVPASIPVDEYADFLEPLGTIEELSSTYEEEFLYKCQKDGVVYGLASGFGISNGLVYNKAVFEAAGVTELPTTPEAFNEALQKIKDNTDAIPLYTNTHDAWTLAQWQSSVSAASGDPTYVNNVMCNEETPFDAGKPAYVVYKVLYDSIANGLTEEDPFTTEWEGSKLMMAKGEVGCMVLGSWALSQMQGVATDNGLNADDIAYMPFPVSNAEGEVVVGVSGDNAYGINVNSDNKATARAFVEFMLQESGYAQSQGMISIVIGDEFPAALADFEGSAFQVDEPATAENEGKWDAVHNESELGLWSGSEYQVMIVEAATGNRSETFDEIMTLWNEQWKAALETVNAE